MQEAAADGGPCRHFGRVDEQLGSKVYAVSVLGRCLQKRDSEFGRAAEGEVDRHLPQCNNLPGAQSPC